MNTEPGTHDIPEERLLEIVVEITLAFCRCVKVELSEEADRHFADIFRRTVLKGVRNLGLGWWDEGGGRTYALNRACQLGNTVSQGEHPQGGPIGEEALEEALADLTERTKESIRRMALRDAGVSDDLRRWLERHAQDWEGDVSELPDDVWPMLGICP